IVGAHEEVAAVTDEGRVHDQVAGVPRRTLFLGHVGGGQQREVAAKDLVVAGERLTAVATEEQVRLVRDRAYSWAVSCVMTAPFRRTHRRPCSHPRARRRRPVERVPRALSIWTPRAAWIAGTVTQLKMRSVRNVRIRPCHRRRSSPESPGWCG